MIHELKTWIDPFTAIVSGMKRHEIRKNDRQFEPGDVLVLREYDEECEEYTGRVVTVAVSYISRGGTWGLPANMDVMSIRLMILAPNDPAYSAAIHGGVDRSACEDRLKEWAAGDGFFDDAGTC